MPQAPLPGAETISGVFEEVLAGPEFGQPRGFLLERILRRIGEVLRAVFGDWLPALDDGQVRLLSWALVGASACLVGWIAWRKATHRAPRPRRPSRPTAEPGPRSAADWVGWARSEQGSGRLRRAATGLYQAVVLHLESRGVVRYGPWKTPGDYAAEVTDAEAGPSFESFLALFVAVAFGADEPTHESLDSLFARAERLGCPT